MGEQERCFLCAWELGELDGQRANVRTEHEPWRQVRICQPCAKRLAGVGEAKILRDGEPLTVRVQM